MTMKTPRVAQLGCGYWGRNLARNFSELGALAAIVDGNPETAERMSEQYKVPARSMDEVLSDSTIDAVAIATPAETHEEVVIKALRGGKHVFVEKPLAMSVDECDRIVKASESAGRLVMVGHLLQYHPVFQACKAMVASGAIGKLRYLYSNRLSMGKLRTEEDVLWSFAPHDLSMILSIADSEVVSMKTSKTDFVTPGIADACTVDLTFANGVGAHVFVSWVHPFKEQRLVVTGDAGTLVFEDSRPNWNEKLRFYPYEVRTENGAPVAASGEPRYIDVPQGEPLKLECTHFLECVAKGTAPLTGLSEGLAVVAALSGRTGRDQL